MSRRPHHESDGKDEAKKSGADEFLIETSKDKDDEIHTNVEREKKKVRRKERRKKEKEKKINFILFFIHFLTTHSPRSL